MILPCEIAVKSLIPAIKATIAKELIETHNLKQIQVAKILRISQSAVSKYTRQVRGYTIKIEKIEETRPLINKMINLITNPPYQREEFLKTFCQTCMTIRKMSVMCQFCQKTDPEIKIKECHFCLSQK